MPKRYAATNLVEDIEEADRKKLWDTATSTDKTNTLSLISS